MSRGGRSFVVLGHGLFFAVNGDDVDGEVFGFVAKCALLLADGLAVVLGALSQIDGCGVVSHACHTDGSPWFVSPGPEVFVHSLCESCSAHIQPKIVLVASVFSHRIFSGGVQNPYLGG